MKETDAFKLFCPFSNVQSQGNNLVANTGQVIPANNPVPVYCIGTKCMAWNPRGSNPNTGGCGLIGEVPAHA